MASDLCFRFSRISLLLALLLGLFLSIGCSGSDPQPPTGGADTIGATDTGVATSDAVEDSTSASDAADGEDANGKTDGGNSDSGNTDGGTADAGPTCPGAADCACKEDKDCTGGTCAMGANGKSICAKPCKEDADCGDLVCADGKSGKVCADGKVALCSPCSANADCAVAGAKDAACVATGAEGNFCSVGCAKDADCGDGYSCTDSKDVDGTAGKRCLPKDNKACGCSGWATAKALSTTCWADGKPGCTGKRSCSDKGLTACDAVAGKVEICDGVDTDCDGTADNGDLCDDKNPCTKDSCGGKAGCKNAADDAAKCDDGDSCTEKDACTGGKCGGAAKVCNDNKPCTDDSCDKAKGCVALPNTATCTDGDSCTEKDGCAAGACTGSKITCDDKNACTDDSCDPKKGCVHLNNKIACNDGDACTDKDTCKEGKCTSVAKDCDDKNPCTTDMCDAKTGCKSVNNFSTCDDGDACTSSDMCKDGKCQTGVVKCVDGKACTKDSCDPKTGICTYPNATDGSKCDDGKKCTISDACAKGKCTGAANKCDDSNPCTSDSCSTSKGCLHTPVCIDGDACTSDTCDTKTGKCAYTAMSECGKTAFKLPYAASFSCGSAGSKLWTLTGTAGGPSWAVDKTPVSPKPVLGDCSLNFNNGKDYKCPTGAKLVSGTATSPKIDLTAAVNPGVAFKYGGKWETLSYYEKMELKVLVEGSKTPETIGLFKKYSSTGWLTRVYSLNKYAGKTIQLVFSFWTKDCFNNSAVGPFIDAVVVSADTCASASQCDDNNPCTTDTCDSKTNNCAHAKKTSGACDDGKNCTVSTTCQADGKCGGGSPKCDDGNSCTKNTCATSTGKCGFSLLSSACEDGNLCSVGDKCKDGLCFAGENANCDDNNSCTVDACDSKSGLCTHKATAGCVPTCKTDADCGDGNPCTTDACDAKTSKCVSTKLKDGAICGGASSCKAGTCGPAAVTGWAKALRSGADANHTCVLHASGRISCWGDGYAGQLGNGAKTDSGKPVNVDGITDATDVVLGSAHTCALHKDGTVSCWGDNAYYQALGSSKTDNTKPVKITGLKDVEALAAGRYHTCALVKGGTVTCWGRNYDKEVGPTAASGGSQKLEPVQGLTGVSAIFAGGFSSCAIRQDETLWCWGRNSYYLAAGGDDITTTGDLKVPTRDGRFTGVTTVSMGYYTRCVGLKNGQMICGAYNSNGQLGTGAKSTTTTKKTSLWSTSAAQFGVGYWHVAAMDAAGQTWGAGDNAQGQLGNGKKTDSAKIVAMGIVSKAIEIAVGYEHTCILRADGTVWCTGENSDGQLGMGKIGSTYDSARYVRVADASCQTDGNCQDDNLCTKQQCSLSDGLCTSKAVKDIACSDGDACTVDDKCNDKGVCLAKPKNCADDDACTMGPVCKLGACSHSSNVDCDDGNACTTDACDKKTGACSHAKIAGCVIKCSTDAGCKNNNLCTTGKCVNGGCQETPGNDGALCADGKTCSKGACAPFAITGWAKQISAHPRSTHACALKTDATVACWGYNYYGQLGDGTKTQRTSPVDVKGLTDVTAVQLGGRHSCALLKDTTVKCWGYNTYGQLGNGTTSHSSSPVAVKGLTGVIELAAGYDSTCALKTDSTVHCWGHNYDGMLGNGQSGYNKKSLTPIPNGLNSIKHLSGGYRHYCALKSDQSTWCWGYNLYQQAVPGTSSSDVLKPTLAKGLAKSTAVAAGGNHTCVVTAAGGVNCIGRNTDGQLGMGAKSPSDSNDKVYAALGVSNIISLAGGYYHTVALDSTGRAWTWGDNSQGELGDGTKTDNPTPQKLNTPTGVIQVTAGDDFTCALLKTGSVWCVGDNSNGELGIGSTSDKTDFVRTVDKACQKDIDCQIGSACFADTCDTKTGLCTEVINKGKACDDGKPCTVGDACDDTGGCAAKPKTCDDGDACTLLPKCDDKDGSCKQLAKVNCDDKNPCTTDKCDAKTGACSHAAISGCKWTCKSDADCDDGKPCTADKCLSGTGTCEQKPGDDGAICGIGGLCKSGSCGPITKGFAKAISSNEFGSHTCALGLANKVYCWGYNFYGQLGDGTTTKRSKPVQVKDLGDASQISAGYNHTCAVLASGRVSCWGNNSDGQLGDGTTTKRTKPVTVDGLNDVSRVGAGGYHSCAVKKNGTVWCWGRNSDGQSGNGKTSTADVKKAKQVAGVAGAVDIELGRYTSCALMKDGAVMCWGYNTYTAIGPNKADQKTPIALQGLPPMSQISHGMYTFGGISKANMAWGSGFNNHGQTGVGDKKTPVWPPKVALMSTTPMQVSTGYYMAYFLDTTGQAWSVGYNLYGGLGNGTTSSNEKIAKIIGGSNVVAVSVRYRGGCLLKADGSVWCVGRGNYGQNGNGTLSSTVKNLVKVSPPVAP
ncbi:MAG: hypothetical protein KC502_09350 [Myxococcales bacterium]|nr:hypothetical protein [Myxococcales bacterium]